MEDDERTRPTRRRRGGSEAAEAAASATMAWVSVGDLLAGRYKLVRELGAGAMGIVYEAEDQNLDGYRVAIKVLPPELSRDEASVLRMKREALAAKKLTHPNVLRLDSFEQDDKVAFLVMELLNGEPLSLTVAKRERLPPDEVLALAKGLCEGLDLAHKKGVIHRDIKPSNLQGTVEEDGELVVKIVDFGIAYQVKNSMTKLTGVEASGTLNYCPPEQLKGARPSPASDQYALAASLFELLDGEVPFSGAGLSQQIREATPREIPDIPPAMNAALQRALAKDPADRFDSLADFYAAFSGEGGAASPPAPAPASAPTPEAPVEVLDAPDVEVGGLLSDEQASAIPTDAEVEAGAAARLEELRERELEELMDPRGGASSDPPPAPEPPADDGAVQKSIQRHQEKASGESSRRDQAREEFEAGLDDRPIEEILADEESSFGAFVCGLVDADPDEWFPGREIPLFQRWKTSMFQGGFGFALMGAGFWADGDQPGAVSMILGAIACLILLGAVMNLWGMLEPNEEDQEAIDAANGLPSRPDPSEVDPGEMSWAERLRAVMVSGLLLVLLIQVVGLATTELNRPPPGFVDTFAVMDEPFTKVTDPDARYGERYDVTYSFELDGVTHQGAGSLDYAPSGYRDRRVRVRVNSLNPSESFPRELQDPYAAPAGMMTLLLMGVVVVSLAGFRVLPRVLGGWGAVVFLGISTVVLGVVMIPRVAKPGAGQAQPVAAVEVQPAGGSAASEVPPEALAPPGQRPGQTQTYGGGQSPSQSMDHRPPAGPDLDQVLVDLAETLARGDFRTAEGMIDRHRAGFAAAGRLDELEAYETLLRETERMMRD